MKEKDRIKRKLSFKNMAKILGNYKTIGGPRRSSSASSFREHALQANSMLQRNTRSKLADKEKVPISEEQIDYMVKMIKRRESTLSSYDVEPNTYEEKLLQSRFTRSTQKY